jgi:hypothetical protein
MVPLLDTAKTEIVTAGKGAVGGIAVADGALHNSGLSDLV